MANVYTVFIFVVLTNRWFVENFVQAEMNAETVFEFLSRRLDSLLVETVSLKSRVQELESQCTANKNEEITKVTESTHLVDRKIDMMAHEREVISKKKNAQAVHKMMYVEKRLIREALETFNDRFEVLESKITEKMTILGDRIEDELLNIKASLDLKGRQTNDDINQIKENIKDEWLNMTASHETRERQINDDINQIKENMKDELLKMNASLEARGIQIHDVINDLSIKAKNNIIRMTFDLQAASDKLVVKLDSHIQEQRARVAEVEHNLTSTREAMSVIEARLNTCKHDNDDTKFYCFLYKVEVGDRVKRGRDWKWGNQDGNGTGTVTGLHSQPGWVTVQWEFNKSSNQYRNGAQNSYDLRIL